MSLKVYFDQNEYDATVKMFVVSDENGHRYVLEPDGDGRVRRVELIPGGSHCPVFQVDGLWALEFLKAIAEGLARLNVKAPEQSFIEGKLEATERHMKDLRMLLKLEGKK